MREQTNHPRGKKKLPCPLRHACFLVPSDVVRSRAAFINTRIESRESSSQPSPLKPNQRLGDILARDASYPDTRIAGEGAHLQRHTHDQRRAAGAVIYRSFLPSI